MHGNTHCSTHCNTPQHIVRCVTALYLSMQHTATHCNTLQHTTTHCNTLQHTLQQLRNSAVPITQQHTATHYNTLQHTATHCNTLQCTATRIAVHTVTHCNTLQRIVRFITALYLSLQHTATHCNTLPQQSNTHRNTHCTTHYKKLQHAATHTAINAVTHCCNVLWYVSVRHELHATYIKSLHIMLDDLGCCSMVYCIVMYYCTLQCVTNYIPHT